MEDTPLLAPLSIQLYTLRAESKVDFPAVIERLGRIGYAGVEPAGLGNLSAREFKQRVDDAGMVVSGAHAPLPVGDAATEILDQQEALGNEHVIVAFYPAERFADADSVRRVAEDLNAANENVRARGMKLGYHNHWWEFQNRIEGETAHAFLFGLLDPAIFAEIDTYWAQVGGSDPEKVVSELGSRARLLHVKDGPAQDPKEPMTAVGDGVLDFEAILSANDAAWHVVELDRCATDMFDAVEKSHRYLTGAGLSRGRS